MVAATLQHTYINIFGENKFNYITGGLVSLFIGVLLCNYVGDLLFLLAKSWHVCALAYLPKIMRTSAPPVTVGMKLFKKTFISFGAIYSVKLLLKNLYDGVSDKLWDILHDVPYLEGIGKVANNPIVKHVANDILHFGFDASIFYLVRHNSEVKTPQDAMPILTTALKKYLYVLPSIMLTSILSYVLFRILPEIIKWIIVMAIILTQGLVAGILILVLMFPISYIIENSIFEPLTMMIFLNVFEAKCDEDVDDSSSIVSVVNSLFGADSSKENKTGKNKNSRTKKKGNIGTTSDDFVDFADSEASLGMERESRNAHTMDDADDSNDDSGFTMSDLDMDISIFDEAEESPTPIRSSSGKSQLDSLRDITNLLSSAGSNDVPSFMSEHQNEEEDDFVPGFFKSSKRGTNSQVSNLFGTAESPLNTEVDSNIQSILSGDIDDDHI